MTTATLPPPTVVDLIDNAVGAVNELLMYVYKVHGLVAEGAPRPTWWATLVEADYLLNTVQDSIREEHP